MSDSEGEVKADPFGGWVMDGDLVEDECDARVSRSPFPPVWPFPFSLELFRWNKRISEGDGASRSGLLGFPPLVPGPDLLRWEFHSEGSGRFDGFGPWVGLGVGSGKIPGLTIV